MRISSPLSPNDGKEVEVLEESGGYDAIAGCLRAEFATVRLVGTDKVGGIERKYLVDLLK
jgi:hypothetical protein